MTADLLFPGSRERTLSRPAVEALGPNLCEALRTCRLQIKRFEARHVDLDADPVADSLKVLFESLAVIPLEAGSKCSSVILKPAPSDCAGGPAQKADGETNTNITSHVRRAAFSISGLVKQRTWQDT